MTTPADSSFLFSMQDLLALAGALVLSGGAWARAEILARNAAKIADQALVASKDNAEKCEKESRERSEDVKRIALEAHIQCTGLQAQLSLFREKVASDYVNREMMRELEARLSADMDRISASVENMSQHIGASMQKLAERLDRVLEGRER